MKNVKKKYEVDYFEDGGKVTRTITAASVEAASAIAGNISGLPREIKPIKVKKKTFKPKTRR